MDDLSCFCCLNSNCPEHGKRGAGNLTVTSRYGTHKQRRMFRCRSCRRLLVSIIGVSSIFWCGSLIYAALITPSLSYNDVCNNYNTKTFATFSINYSSTVCGVQLFANLTVN